MRAMLSVFMVLLFTPAASAGPFKELRDVNVYCSNGLSCMLELALPQAAKGGNLYRAGIWRRNGPDSPPELKLSGSKPFKPGSLVNLSVDGKPAAAIAAADFKRDDDFQMSSISAGSVVLPLIAAMRNGSKLVISSTTDEGDESAEISLSGFAAALLWFDEVQDRLGTKDALEAKGGEDSRPASVRDLLSLDDLPEAMRPLFKSEGECEFFEPERFGRAGGFVIRLDESWSYVVAPCGEGGAYNQPFALYSLIGEDFTSLELPGISEDGPFSGEEVWNVGWDQTTGMLDSFFKGRGLGDCGVYNKWHLRAVDGAADFVLAESRVMDECDGEGGELEDWPKIWPPAGWPPKAD